MNYSIHVSAYSSAWYTPRIRTITGAVVVVTVVVVMATVAADSSLS